MLSAGRPMRSGRSDGKGFGQNPPRNHTLLVRMGGELACQLAHLGLGCFIRAGERWISSRRQGMLRWISSRGINLRPNWIA